MIKYFCDVCGEEEPSGSPGLAVIRGGMFGDDISICRKCWKGIKREIRKRRKHTPRGAENGPDGREAE